MTARLGTALAGYAERLHAVAGEQHHVASPLGCWLLLALCATAATDEGRDELTAVLGVDPQAAAAAAASLLETEHPAVLAAAAVWGRPAAADSGWLSTLPDPVERGELPSQLRVDAWASEHTRGLIERFPLQLNEDTLLVLATALATRVSWEQPFDVVSARELGQHSAWAQRLSTVLRTPDGYGHTQYIATTDRAGDVAVHTALAREGLQVTSVAAAPGVPVTDVLAAAYDLARSIGAGGPVRQRSLFDLPLGDGPLWTIAERPTLSTAENGREERCTAVLPAWSARSVHDLRRADLGFNAAAGAVARALGVAGQRYEARQSALARYSRVGFEAAAVTAMAVPMGMPLLREGTLRVADLRFGHPHAVVAVATQMDYDADRGVVVRGAWHDVPVFSAWVAEPEDAGGDSEDPGTVPL